MLARFLALCLCLAPVLGSASLTQRERKGLEDTLFIAGLTEEDLGYDKKATKDPHRLPLNRLALDRPLVAADALLDLHEKGKGTLADALSAGCQAVFGDRSVAPGNPAAAVQLPAPVPEQMRQPLQHLLECISEADGHIRTALKAVDPRERRELIEGLPQWAAGTDLVKFGFVKQPRPDPAAMMALLAKVDLGEIRLAGVRLAKQVEAALPTWRSLSKTVPLTGTIRFRVDSMAVEISGQGDDEHAALNTSLCIDLGGRNHYSGRYGAGIGYASVLIDCGSSRFDVPDLSIGAGMLGVGLAYELGDDAQFRGHSLCFGSGIAGVGALFDDGGQTSFESVALSQGFGMFGCGLLMCTGGSDEFRADLFSQGAARPQGLGWLISQQGNDVFRAGGLVPAIGGHRTCGQGYAEGLGSNSGGVGLLTGFGSGTSYVGEVGCQGAGTDGGLGSFYDSGGGGSRNASLCAQGYAEDQASAYLFDLGGNASFAVKRAACHGFASDLSIAFVLAQGGNDLFASGDGRPATAVNGGLSIVLSDGPANTFGGAPGLTLPSSLDSVGLFCSIGGACQFLGSTPTVAQVGDGAGVYIQPSVLPGDAPSPPSDLKPSTTLPEPKETDPVSDAGSSDPFLARAALISLIRSAPAGASGTAVALLKSPDLLVRRAALRLLAKYPEAAMAASQGLLAQGDDQSSRIAVRLFGAVGTPDALASIGKLLGSSSSGVTVEALVALNGRVPADFVEQVSKLRSSPDPLVRSVAQGVSID